MTTVTLKYSNATVYVGDDAVWDSGTEFLADYLNAAASRDEARRRYGYLPNVPICMAELAVEILPGAEIAEIDYTGDEPYDRNAVY